MDYFTRCLESAIANNLKKVTFIHGVGTGVLKSAIKERLAEYENIEYRDASMQQFGYGATDVILKS
jgi:dsDNA-specific endonuclease/ATPase MutS2